MTSVNWSAHVTAADGGPVIDALIKRSAGPPGYWLTPTNSYLGDPVAALDHDRTSTTKNWGPLLEYLALASTAGTLEGWGCLGRAVNALAGGALPEAIHLGYYAELRAALAILASNGIGIFGQWHVIVDNGAACHLVHDRRGTHAATWEALSAWSKGHVAGQYLASLLKPFGIGIGEFGVTSSAWRAAGASWIEDWGLDLKLAVGDKDLRNQVSYRPRMTLVGEHSSRTASTFLCRVWELGSEPFALADQLILKSVFESSYSAIKGQKRPPRRTSESYSKFVALRLVAIPCTDAQRLMIQGFLTNPSGSPKESILNYAGYQSTVGDLSLATVGWGYYQEHSCCCASLRDQRASF